MFTLPDAAVHDPARLAALQSLDLLDTPADPAFDRLTRLAARFLSAPLALVSLVDADRQFFKSCVGPAAPPDSVRETPLSHSFCQYVVATGEPLVVEDARQHPFLHDNLAITDLGVIAYLGIPLIAPGGHVLGSFCVTDTAPRAWTADQVETMRDLAGAAATEIELRADIRQRQRVEQALSQERDLLEALMDNLPDSIYFKDRQSRFIKINHAQAAFLGMRHPDEAVGLSDLDLQPPELARGFFEEEQQMLADGQTLIDRIEFNPTADGRPRWISATKAPMRDRSGRVIGLVGISRDVTERMLADEERQRLQDEIIRIQAATLAELSTPLIPLSDQVVVMPLIGAVDSRRAQQVVDALLHGIAETRAQVAILDITGVPVVDTQVAHGLLGAARAVRLLGADVVLTGIRPEVAQTLVGLGADLSGIVTLSTLQSGIAFAIGRRPAARR